MNHFKIITSDLDGTLLNGKSEISHDNQQAIHEMVKRGVLFVPSTGRTLSELPVEIISNPAIRYIIHSNGAVVLDRQTNQRVLTCLPRQTTGKILDVLNSFETHITVRQNGNCFVDAALTDEASYDYYNVCEPHRVVVRKYAKCLDEFKEFAYQAENVEVISAFFHDGSKIAACRKKIEELGDLRVVAVDKYNLEIMNIHAGKGNALCALADMAGVDIADTISIGDSDNDESMILAAGLGLAVSNAWESLKAVADAVICSNEEHVLAYILAHYL